MRVKVSGTYRFDAPHSFEQGLKDYAVEFEVETPIEVSPKIILEKASSLVRAQDGKFDSFKTHKIETSCVG